MRQVCVVFPRGEWDFKDLCGWIGKEVKCRSAGYQDAEPELLLESIFPSSICIRTGANAATESL